MEKENSAASFIDEEIREILKAQTFRCIAAARAELRRVCLADSPIGKQILNAIANCAELES